MTNKNMLSSYFDAFKSFAIFEGRTNRFDYWSFILINLFVTLALSTFPRLSISYSVLALLPALAITVRRLHDTNRSGWFILPIYVITGFFAISLMYFIANPASLISIYAGSTLLKSLYVLLFIVLIFYYLYIFCLTCFKSSEEENIYGKKEETEEEDKKAKVILYAYIVISVMLGFIFIFGSYVGYKSTQKRMLLSQTSNSFEMQ